MADKEPVSVIIPVLNGGKFLAEAIESILTQTVRPFEILVVDDGSTDDTETVAKRFNRDIRYVYQDSSGVAAARNKGLELAQGEIIGFLDADDIWLKNKLEIQLELLQKHPEYEMVIGLLRRVPFLKTKEVLEQEIITGEYVTSLGSLIIKKQVFDKVGKFDEEMTLGEDVDLFLRVLESGTKVWAHEDVVQICRRHTSNITLNEKRKNFYLLKAFKKSLGRRRESGQGKITDLPPLGNIDGLINYWQSQKRS